MKKRQWILVVACILIVLIFKNIEWNGFEIIIDFKRLETTKFIFQYLYYVFETALLMLTIIFGQKAFELWLNKEKFHYGGILVAITWGITHIFSQGNIKAGIEAILIGFIF